jgi:peptidoglycan hydrolase-like protein with peptidoglycan-binding domain
MDEPLRPSAPATLRPPATGATGADPWLLLGGALATLLGVVLGTRWASRKGIRIPVLSPLFAPSSSFASPLPIPVRRWGRMTPFAKSIQLALAAKGYPSGTPDGVWGANTAKAALAFQRDHGLAQTGLAEPDLVRALGLPIPALPPNSGGAPAVAQALVTTLQGVVSPGDAAKIMLHESGLDPTADNGAAVGVFQLDPFQPSVVGGLSRAAYKALTAAQQIPFAAKFWRNVASQFRLPLPLSARDLYWTNYLPATVKPGAGDDYAFCFSNDTYLNAATGERVDFAGCYTKNQGLDHGKKGFITAGDMASAAQEGAMDYPDRYAAVMDAVQRASGTFANV